MAGRHRRLNSPYPKLVLCVYLSMLLASHRFLIRFYLISIYCIYLVFGFELGFECYFPVCAVRERASASSALMSHFWKHWPVVLSTCELLQRRRGQSWSWSSCCWSSLSADSWWGWSTCYFPMDQPSAALSWERVTFFPFFLSFLFFLILVCSRRRSLSHQKDRAGIKPYLLYQ